MGPQQVMAVSRSRDEINNSDPALAAVCTAYATPPFPPFSHPPIKLPSLGPGGHLYLDRGIDCTAVRFAVLVRIKLHMSLEHVGDSGGTEPRHERARFGSQAGNR